MARSIAVHSLFGILMHYRRMAEVLQGIRPGWYVWIGPKAVQQIIDPRSHNLAIYKPKRTTLDYGDFGHGKQVSANYAHAIDAREAAHRRQARLAAADGFHTPEQWEARVRFYGWRCRYCGCQLQRETLTKDHQVAVSNGGSEWASNLVPACKPCNSWKRDRRVRVIGS